MTDIHRRTYMPVCGGIHSDRQKDAGAYAHYICLMHIYTHYLTQWEQRGLNSRADLAAFAAIPHHPDYVAPGDRMHHMRQVQVREG